MNDSPFTTIGDEPVEARIVAWVLGEASAFEEAELERLCEQRPELLVFRRRMRALHGLLTEAEKQQADEGWKLPPEKRRALDEIFGEESVVRLEAEKEKRVRHSGRRALLAIAACVMLAFVALALVPRKYRAEVTLEVKPRLMSPLGAQYTEYAGGNLTPPQFFGTEFEKIKSRNSLEKVVENLDLTRRWGVDKETALKRLKSNVETQNIRGTDLISIQVRDASPKDARDIAEEVANAYKEYRSGIERRESEQALAKLRKAVQDQEEKVEERRKTLSTIMLTKDIVYKGGDSFYDKSGADEDQGARSALETYNKLLQEKMELESQVASMSKYDNERQMAFAAGLDLPDNSIRDLYPKYQEAKRNLDSKKVEGLGDDHPTMLAAKEQVETMKKQLDEGVANLQQNLGNRLDLASNRLKGVEEMKRKTREEAIKRGLDAQDYVDARRDLQTEQELLQTMRLKLIGEDTAVAMQADSVEMHNAPVVSDEKEGALQAAASTVRSWFSDKTPADKSIASNEAANLPAPASAPASSVRPRMRSGSEIADSSAVASRQPAPAVAASPPTTQLEPAFSGMTRERRADAPVDLAKNENAPGAGAAGGFGGGVKQELDFKGGKDSAAEDAIAKSVRFHSSLDQDRGGERDIALQPPSFGRRGGTSFGDAAVPEGKADTEPQMPVLGGRLAEAGERAETAARAGDSTDGAVRQLERGGIADSMSVTAVPAEARQKKVDELRRDLTTAEGNYNLGKFEDARKNYEQALSKDPYNAAARRGLERIEAAKSDYYRAAYDHTRAELLAQVDNSWELAVPAEGAKEESQRESKTAYGLEAPQKPAAAAGQSWAVQDEAVKVPAQAPAKAKPDLTKLIEEVATAEDPYSTFSLNISDASFQIAQAALAKGERPDPAGVKVEQFYNAVDYGDPAPAAGEPVALAIEQGAHPVIPGRNLVRVALKTAAAGRSAAQPLRLTLLVDQSGSMSREDRRAAMDKALAGLGSLLTDKDTVTVIGFSRTPRLLADALTGDKAGKLGELVNQSASEGGTNLEEAMKLGGQLAERHLLAGAQNRIVLFTDGAANLGNADPTRLAESVKQLRLKGIAFDIAGIAAADLNDELLGGLARNGNGRYYVVGKGDDENFARQLAGAFRPAAENVKVQVRFNPERVGRYKLIGFEKDRLKTEDFRNDAVDAAELAAEEAGTAIYQVEPIPGGKGELGEVSVRFRDAAAGRMVERSWTIPHDPATPAFDRASPSMQLATLAMLAAEKLKGGPLAQAIDFQQLAGPAANVKRFYGGTGRPAEVLRMVDALK